MIKHINGVCVVCACVSACVCIAWLPGVNWGSKCPTVLVSLSGVEVIVELLVPRPLSMRPGQSSCGLLALPQEDLPAQGSSA